MKISNILFESKVDIDIVLILMNKSVTDIANQITIAENTYHSDPTLANLQKLKQILIESGNKIEDYVFNTVWEKFENDPDIDRVVEEFYQLDQEILTKLKNL